MQPSRWSQRRLRERWAEAVEIVLHSNARAGVGRNYIGLVEVGVG